MLSTGSFASSVAALVVAPIASAATCAVFVYASAGIDLPPLAATYVVVTHGSRRCLATVLRHDGVETVYFNHSPPPGFSNVVTDGIVERFGVEKLPGRVLEKGRVVKVISRPARANIAVLDNHAEVDPVSSCLR